MCPTNEHRQLSRCTLPIAMHLRGCRQALHERRSLQAINGLPHLLGPLPQPRIGLGQVVFIMSGRSGFL